jgi:hypothetical protein
MLGDKVLSWSGFALSFVKLGFLVLLYYQFSRALRLNTAVEVLGGVGLEMGLRLVTILRWVSNKGC